ncbi:CHAP domain-containing protein [Streptosporangiaceae bacterium NEAU-GS5]|nr:CHAP domain-containing protein [Streptosporangiaceae bacterium NEAU-GS5]
MSTGSTGSAALSRAEILAQARRWLGLTGRPNALTRAYADRNGSEYLAAAWCDISVTEWARRSGNAGPVLPNGDRAWTVKHAEDGRGLGRWHPGTSENIRKHARPGCVVFFDWDGSDAIANIDHVGVIERVLPDGRLQTIEANTGDAVKRRIRSAAVVAGFWDPDYEGEDDMAAIDDIAEAVYKRLTGTVTDDLWAAREGLFKAGDKVDPRTALRQIWAYGKDSYAQSRAILARLDAQDATIRALASRDGAVDVEALLARIREEIGSITVHLDAAEPPPAGV